VSATRLGELAIAGTNILIPGNSQEPAASVFIAMLCSN